VTVTVGAGGGLEETGAVTAGAGGGSGMGGGGGAVLVTTGAAASAWASELTAVDPGPLAECLACFTGASEYELETTGTARRAVRTRRREAARVLTVRSTRCVRAIRVAAARDRTGVPE
jgi:hypothetical protein